MNTYYCVKSSVDNHGRMTAAITESVEAETMPQDTLIAAVIRRGYQRTT